MTRSRARIADEAHRPYVHDRPTAIERIAVGVDGRPEGRDAARLAAMIAGATGAEVMLVAVNPDPRFSVAPIMDRTAMQERTMTGLQSLRDSVAPHARTAVETDRSVARALERVVKRERQDLLVVGSSRRAPEGRVRIGRRTRQLLGHAACALAIAPRGFSAVPTQQLSIIGMGYDGEPEAQEALKRAGSLACAAAARLRVLAVVDDRLPYVGWPLPGGWDLQEVWDEVIEPDVGAMGQDAERAASATGADVAVDVKAGCPPEELIVLSQEVDLLVIGSRHWGAAARVLLGCTGEEVMHNARSPVMVVPRPASSAETRPDVASASKPA